MALYDFAILSVITYKILIFTLNFTYKCDKL